MKAVVEFEFIGTESGRSLTVEGEALKIIRDSNFIQIIDKNNEIIFISKLNKLYAVYLSN